MAALVFPIPLLQSPEMLTPLEHIESNTLVSGVLEVQIHRRKSMHDLARASSASSAQLEQKAQHTSCMSSAVRFKSLDMSCVNGCRARGQCMSLARR